MSMTIKNSTSEEEKDAMPERERVYMSETETDSLPYCLFPDNGGDKSNENHYRVLKRRFEGERK